MNSYRLRPLSISAFSFVAVLGLLVSESTANLVISEIMYNPPGLPEDVAAEFIEIHNNSDSAVDLQGYRIDAGVEFLFSGSVIAAGGYIVVAADLSVFESNHPTVTGVVGPWTGKLKNSVERIRLVDAGGKKVDEVKFADQGDWAMRERGPIDRGHEGWIWLAPHDGGGKSLELINPELTNNNGQNWGSSSEDGGSPGSVNSVASTDIAPIISKFKHRPQIPGSGDRVTVSCEIKDESPPGESTARLFWRVDGEDNFESLLMEFDGSDGFSAEIPAHDDGVIVEFFVEVDDGVNSRSWPAAVSGGGHQANALYQVDDAFDPEAARMPGRQPTYYVILTEEEREELEDIGTSSSRSESNAQMNATFVSAESASIKTIYCSSIRNRGAGSRDGPPNNHLVGFRSDEEWKGVRSIKFNCRYVHSQTTGSWLFQLMGVEVPDTVAVQLRINGENLAQSGGPLMYGSYAMVETLGSDFTAAHWPEDPNGNLYQVRDDEDTGEEGDLRYEGEDAGSYRNTYFKQTNSSEDDWSDLIALTDVLNNSPAESYYEDVSRYVDINQWLTHLAVDGLLGNREGGLNDGKGDDYVLYRGIVDQRFRFVPHDLDTLLRGGVAKNIWGYADLDGLEKFLNHPDIIPLYYAKYLDLIERVYRPEIIQPVIERAVGGFISNNALQAMKEYVPGRITAVLSQIPRSYSAASDLPVTQEGYSRTNTGAVRFSGDFHAARVRSVLINGTPAQLDARAGRWQLQVDADGGDVINPGLNRIVVQFFSGRSGTGRIFHVEYLDVWYNTGSVTEVSGTLSGGAAQGVLHLNSRDSYSPGTPLLVKVDFRKIDGSYAREIWDATAILNADSPGVSIIPDTVQLRNGVGTALITVGGGPGGEPVILVPLGGVWKYLDDGSDQGTAWRNSGFDDSSWESGPAELGYGDNDEETEVGYGGSSNDKHATTYFRADFEVEDAALLTGLELRLLYDDGAIVYLNGNELHRTSNMASNMAYDEYTVDGDDTPDEDRIFLISDLSSSLLVDGTNTLAVEVKQGDEESSDISFNLELIAQAVGSGVDPGNFILTANSNGQRASKTITSLGFSPLITEISGDLTGAASTWSGVMRLTGDVTVPREHVLTVEPGTLVLLDGTIEAQSTTGTDLIIQGTIDCRGSEEQPITFTASEPDAPWGQILFDQSEGANFTFTNIHRAGHSPGGGHTGHGRVLRIIGSTVSFNDCNITDNRGKVGESGASGGSNSAIILRRCHLARSVMGLETFDTDVLVEDCHFTDMLGIYREDGVTDDNDAIYLHGAGEGQSITLRNLVVAYIDDDGIDTLDADVVLEEVISRNCGDKGASLFTEDITITGGLFVNNSIGISAKDDARVTLKFVTVANNELVGIQAENKDGSDDPSFYTISNSIIWGNADAIRTDYDPEDISVSYCDLEEPWDGSGNINSDPVFVAAGAGNFKLSAGSPAIGAGDPEDGSPDLGYFPFQPQEGAEVRWTPRGGPYHVIDDVTIPVGTALVVEPGTSVYFDEDKKLRINGISQIVGTPTSRIQFSPVPGVPFVPDSAGNGSLPDGPPKSEGIKIIDSMNPNNRIAHIDIGHAQDREGAIGIIRSQCVVDDVRFYGTKIRIFYTLDASIILENCRFPDVFGPDEQADELDLDNISEQVKGEGEIPEGGRYIIRNNTFGITKGHNDVVDVDSGRRPGPIVQIIGNTFTNTGDEHIDLGGDVFVAGNVFRNVFKDDETSDRGYANAISTGDAGLGTTIVVARNIFWDIDHCINLKIDTSTIFENNTVYKIHPDFNDRFENPSVASVVNLFVPTDTDVDATHGDGAYVSGNLLMEIPRVFSGADDAKEEPFPTTPLEFFDNLVDPVISDIAIGQNHGDQTIYDLGSGNATGVARFMDAEMGNFALAPGSAGIAGHPMGHDLGAMVREGIFISGEPPARTSSPNATLRVAGPGIWNYRWRVNGGDWSGELPIGNGFDPPNATVRKADIELSDLDDGTYIVEVEGQTFAGSWQAEPTVSKAWTVNRVLPASVVINEVLAVNDAAFEHEGTFPDLIELYNAGTVDYDLGGHWFSDDPDSPGKAIFAPGTIVPAGGYLLLFADDAATSGIHLGFTLDRSGEQLALYRDGIAVDSVSFGIQAGDLSIGRVGHDGEWQLNQPTPGFMNVRQPTGNAAGVRISEWFANGQVALADEFIELYNPDSLPVEISGMFLTDNPNTALRLEEIPQLSYIAASGFGVIEPGDFGLSSTMELIGFAGADGELIDAVIYGVQAEDYSQVRNVSGDGEVGFSRVPTPGISTPNATENEYLVSLLDSLRITEIMFNPPGGSDYEYIEFENIGDSHIELAGVRLTAGVSFVFPEVMLSPGEQILVVKNSVAFEHRYGSGSRIVGEYAGKLDNDGETLRLELPEPYNVAILRFEYSDNWYDNADGGGVALQVIDPAAGVRSYQDRKSWDQSDLLGSPGGTIIVDSFAQWAAREGIEGESEDPDGDGLGNVVEYAIGSAPLLPSALPAPQTPDRVGNSGLMVWEVEADLRRVDVRLLFEYSDDLRSWEQIPAAIQTGAVSVRYSVVLPLGQGRRFCRLRVILE
ncbi:MAG: lamin tail domain-containing protein [Verrucomicrobiales bacterium]